MCDCVLLLVFVCIDHIVRIDTATKNCCEYLILEFRCWCGISSDDGKANRQSILLSFFPSQLKQGSASLLLRCRRHRRRHRRCGIAAAGPPPPRAATSRPVMPVAHSRGSTCTLTRVYVLRPRGHTTHKLKQVGRHHQIPLDPPSDVGVANSTVARGEDSVYSLLHVLCYIGYMACCTRSSVRIVHFGHRTPSRPTLSGPGGRGSWTDLI